MRVAILGNSGCWHAGRLAAALNKRGVEIGCFLPHRLYASVGSRPYVFSEGNALEEYDALVVRSLPGGSLEQVIFRVDVLHRLENAGVLVINKPGCIEKTVDKYYTSALLEANGIPTPKTIVTERFEEAMSAFKKMRNVVVKPLFGSLGLGMVHITDEDTAYRVFRAWQACRYVFYIQEFIPHENKDLRAFVLGPQVIASMLRMGDGWKTNINRGARGKPVQLDSYLEKLCLRTADVLGAQYLGVDILVSTDGLPYIVEANSIPGWKGLQETTKVDIAQAIADYIIKLVRGEDS